MREEISGNIILSINNFVKELSSNVALHIETVSNNALAFKINNAIIPYLDLAKKWAVLGNEHQALSCYLKAMAFYTNRYRNDVSSSRKV